MKTIFVPLAGVAVALAAMASANAATFGEGTSSGIDVAPPGDVQTYSTSNAADVAALHSVSSTTSAYGSSSQGSIDGMAGSFVMQASTQVVDPTPHGCLGCVPLVSQTTDNGGFTDTLHLTSATLADGTPVDLQVSMALTHSDSSSEPYSLYLKGGYLSSFIVGALGLSDDGAGPGPDVDVGVVHTFVGQTINLSGAMLLGTYAEFLDQDARTIQWQATTRYFVDSLTGGVSISSDSGHDYATSAVSPVPEPQEWALLLAGAAAIFWKAKRKAASEGQRSAC